MYLVITMITVPLLSWLFFISFYSTTLFSYGVIMSGQCLGDQQSLLLQLKDSLIFNKTRSKILVRWNQSSDCCSWEGVTCDQEGRVTGLKLSEESISGGIDDNSTLFNLKYLRSLDLSLNSDLDSTIPSRIGNLTNLSYLNFSNSFSGQIPKDMSSLTKLVVLDLSNPSFTTEDLNEYLFADSAGSKFRNLECQNLSLLVHNLRQLEELHLDGVNMSAPARKDWGQALSSSLPNLRVLSLAGCSLSGPIPQSLVKLKFLSVIRLDGNNVSSQLPTFFGNFSNLTSLRLRLCYLNGTFPREIIQLPSLRTLDLSYNYLLEGSLPEFPPSSFLQILDVARSKFQGRLPSSIGNLRRLRILHLFGCRFNGSIPNSIANLTKLVHLNLAQNQLVGPIPSFSACRNLAKIDLSHNQLSGSIPSFNECMNLAEIYLAYNQLSGPFPSLNVCRNLTKIDLDYNQLSGTMSSAYYQGLPNLIEISLRNNSFKGSIPSSLFGLPSLEVIDLSYNQFSQLLEFPKAPSSMLVFVDLRSNELQGPISMSILKLRALRSLSLSFNKFNGTIQLLDFFQGLSNLYHLDLSYNNLSVNVSNNGSYISFLPNLWDLRLASCNLRLFPAELLKNQVLENLDLSNNQIYGDIPNWIWKLGNGSLVYVNLSHNHLVGIQEPYSLYNLGVLDLSFNKLHGKIPMLPPSIYYVDLSSNSFTSSIPSDIGNNIADTSYFSLGNNSLVGVIPKSMCNATALRGLDLSHNSLSGVVPTCLFALISTLAINLRQNKLSGPVPDVFPVDCRLKILDLNGNLLSKGIPKSLANCSALENLDLGNNQIVDTFPKFLTDISTLRVLVLKSNKLYGQITCTESIGDWSMIQVVDVASNNFSGELPGHCLAKWHAMMTVRDYGQTHPLSYADEHMIYQQNVISVAKEGLEMKLLNIVVTSKGLVMEILNILSDGFTYVDFSSNRFDGEIPKELGQLISLHGLNLSNNLLSGHIPSSLGNMRQLESLDLSRNHLTGIIPPSLSNLNFLGFLNISYNQLHGRIPTGSQIQTFSADRFQGNRGLCGPPLTPNCPGDVPGTPINKANNSASSGSKEIEWNLISTEIGFIVGFGGVVGPLVFRKTWRKKYYDRVEDIAFRILPQSLRRIWSKWKTGST